MTHMSQRLLCQINENLEGGDKMTKEHRDHIKFKNVLNPTQYQADVFESN